jgi:hypothetical protein
MLFVDDENFIIAYCNELAAAFADMSCLYHVMQKGHSFINANTYHAE